MTAPTDSAGVTRITRRIAVLPTATGLGAAVLTAIGGTVAITSENSTGGTLVNVATLVVLTAMVSGFVPAHYAGLAALAVAAMFEPDGPGAATVIIMAVTMVVVHELGRLSLDIRHETRFASQVLPAMTVRAAMVAAAAVALVVLQEALADQGLSTGLVPVAFALAAAPLIAHRLIADPPDDELRPARRAGQPGTAVRTALGVALAAAVLLASLAAAQARSQSIAAAPGREPAPAADTGATTPTTVARDVPEVPQSDLNGLVAAAVITLAVIIAGLLWAAFRRPEQAFELDDLNLDDARETIHISLPGRADLDEASVDRAAADAMLDALLLDMRAEPDPGRAIRFGYATVERHLARAGVEQRDHETVHEFLTRAVPTLSRGREEMAALTELFEYARFGLDPVSEGMRDNGIDAVETLRRALDIDSGTAEPGKGERNAGDTGAEA
ncbi:MAG: DUF4129 domain-containing protein [Actinomycetota bacterium]